MYKPTPKDLKLEEEIDAMQRTFLAAPFGVYRKVVKERLDQLHAQRSPAMLRLIVENNGQIWRD